ASSKVIGGNNSNWNLDFSIGQIEAEPLNIDNYKYHLANQVVTSNADVGAGSLRQAIVDAVDGDEITFNLSGGDTLIVLGSPLVIDEDLTIDGNNTDGSGTDITVSGNDNSRVFNISSSTVSISNLTITGGNTSEQGGGIYNYYGTLDLSNCTISSNTAGTFGGGIYNYHGTLDLSNCTISGNTGESSDESSGGIDNCDGTLNLSECIISSNTGTYGGGVSNSRGSATLSNCTISGNTATYGGGMYNIVGDMTLSNCTISGNTAEHGGGGISSVVWPLDATATVALTNCTIANNHSDNDNSSSDDVGGGFFNFYATLSIKNTIIANNYRGSGTVTRDDFYLGGGSVTDNGYNAVGVSEGHSWVGTDDWTDGDGDNTFDGPSSATGSINLSTTLADNNTTNGTQTLKTTNGSIAIDAGNAANNGSESVPTTDQRGADRNGTTDIGAYEYWSDDASLPVCLSLFTAENYSGGVLLKWVTDSEIKNRGFILERKKLENTAWELLTSYQSNTALVGYGSTGETHEYKYVDNAVQPGLSYVYCLGDVDYSGTITRHKQLEIQIKSDNSTIAEEFGLQSAYPNPFNPSLTLHYGLITDAQTTVQIFNLRGQLVQTLVNTYQSAGSYNLTWQPVNIGTGVYIVRLESNAQTSFKKIIFTK
ncbi:T9SS type A sorting domain-containing protein, partial [bacterium]|nr:T9SS type A sorting domain-containing protein [bacterium]